MTVRRKVIQQYGEQELQALVDAYVDLYGWDEIGMTDEDILEEILADAYGGIDIFAGHTYEGATRFTEAVKSAVETEEHSGRKNAAVENDSGGVKYSIQPIVGEKQNYGNGVVLDTNLFDGVSPRNWGKVLNKFVYTKLAGKEMVVYDEDGKAETIYLAKENDRVKKDGSNNSHKVLDKLARNGGNNIRALAVVHLSEALETSSYQNNTDEHNHQWMDENGWEHRITYLQDANGNIYQATLNIANGRDRRILYDINNIRKIDQKNRTADGAVPSTENGRGSLISNSSKGIVPSSGEKVNGKFSREVSTEDLEKMQEKLTKVRQKLYAKTKQAAHWKAEATERHEGKARPGDVAKAANDVVTEFNSTLEAVDIKDRMQRLADGIVSGKMKPGSTAKGYWQDENLMIS